jgi:molecular chaperone DnaK
MRTVGIDLGTTNTVAALDGTVLQHSAGLDHSAIVPSAVAFPPSGATLVGATAKKRRAIDPKNTLFSTKRLMGQRWLSQSATRFRRSYPFDFVETTGGGCAFDTRAGTFTPTEIATTIIQKVFAAQQSLRSEIRASSPCPPPSSPPRGKPRTRPRARQA